MQPVGDDHEAQQMRGAPDLAHHMFRRFLGQRHLKQAQGLPTCGDRGKDRPFFWDRALPCLLRGQHVDRLFAQCLLGGTTVEGQHLRDLTGRAASSRRGRGASRRVSQAHERAPGQIGDQEGDHVRT